MNALQNQISILNATITSLQSQITELEAEKNVTITNWPMQYYDFSFDLNMSWTSGFGRIYLSSAIPTDCSRVFITMHPIGMQAGADATVNVTLMDVSWAPTNSVDYGDEWVTQTLTIYRYETTQFSWLRPMPYEIKTKAPNFIMAFYVTASAPSGWVLMNIYVYQRNE
jgi:hypothetical protein